MGKKKNRKKNSDQMPLSHGGMNLPNKVGVTPLHIAAQLGHFQFCKVCIYDFTFTY